MAWKLEKSAESGRRAAPRSWHLLILLWLVPVLALSFAAYLIASRCVHQLIVSNNRSAARMAQEMLQREIAHIVHFAEASAAGRGFVGALRDRDVAAAQEYLRTMSRTSGQIDDALVCSRDQIVLATSGRLPEYEGSTIDRRSRSFLAAVETKKPQVSAAYLMRRASQRQIVVTVACPVFDPPREMPAGPQVDRSEETASDETDQREMIAVLMCQVRLSELATSVNNISFGSSGHILVVDHRGRLLVHPRLNFEDEPYLEFSKIDQVNAAMDGHGSMVEYDDPLAGNRMCAMFVPVSIAGNRWVVVAQQDATEAYAPIRQMAFQLSLAAAITVIMCLLAVASVRHMGNSLLKEQYSLKQLLDVYERQRQILAFEIHDGLAQELAAALMTFETLARLPEQPEAAQRSAEGIRMLQRCLAEARRLMSGIRPPILDDFGVVAAIDTLVAENRAQSDATIDWCHGTPFDRLAPPLETAVFRIVQEGLTNALRHSASDRVRITLTTLGERVRITIEDWGKGFNLQTAGQGRFGLLGIRERARLLGGRAVIESGPNRGTRILVELPLILRSPDGTRPGGIRRTA